MGIPMDDNIHAPTIPSGPASTRGAGRDVSKVGLPELFNEKERLEAELKILGDVLKSHGVTMSTTLTTFDGYPRDDIDIAQIRTTRAKVICLRNDYKDVMAMIEKGIHAHFAKVKDTDGNTDGEAASSVPAQAPAPSAEVEQILESREGSMDVPFAKVNGVADGSPAADAGLKTGDKICSFGHIDWMNHENLTKLGGVVQNNEGQLVLVKVLRQSDSGSEATSLSLRLTPRRDWGGRGLLGCHLVPL